MSNENKAGKVVVAIAIIIGSLLIGASLLALLALSVFVFFLPNMTFQPFTFNPQPNEDLILWYVLGAFLFLIFLAILEFTINKWSHLLK